MPRSKKADDIIIISRNSSHDSLPYKSEVMIVLFACTRNYAAAGRQKEHLPNL
jgi:hypothetical protein